MDVASLMHRLSLPPRK